VTGFTLLRRTARGADRCRPLGRREAARRQPRKPL